MLLLPFKKVVGIDKYIDKKLYDKKEHTLKWAIEHNSLETVKILIDNGVDVNETFCVKGTLYVEDNWNSVSTYNRIYDVITPIRYSIRKGLYKISELLLNNNANININERYSCYYYSFDTGYINDTTLIGFTKEILNQENIRILDLVLKNISQSILNELISYVPSSNYKVIELFKKYSVEKVIFDKKSQKYGVERLHLDEKSKRYNKNKYAYQRQRTR